MSDKIWIFLKQHLLSLFVWQYKNFPGFSTFENLHFSSNFIANCALHSISRFFVSIPNIKLYTVRITYSSSLQLFISFRTASFILESPTLGNQHKLRFQISIGIWEAEGHHGVHCRALGPWSPKNNLMCISFSVPLWGPMWSRGPVRKNLSLCVSVGPNK